MSIMLPWSENGTTKTSKPHRSIILWPPDLPVGSSTIENETTDTHPSKEAAEAVCRMIMRRGLGGQGKYFPLSWRVEECAE